MLVLSGQQMACIASAAEAAWPAEGCGLLIGRGRRIVTLTRVMAADNLLKAEGHDRFELDPAVRFAAERSVRGTTERIIGHWHSHPDGSAKPSATDMAQAWEPDLIWLIVGIVADLCGRPQAVQMLAHRLDREAGRMSPIRMETAEKRACQAARFPT